MMRAAWPPAGLGRRLAWAAGGVVVVVLLTVGAKLGAGNGRRGSV